MAKVFVSHASADARLAAEIHGWLVEAGHEAFLDTDAEHGLTVGNDWEQRLHRQLRSADALVCVVTAAFVGSTWCTGEVAIARAQGCRLLPVQVEPTARHPFLESVQHIVLTDDGRTRVQLLKALRRIDVGGRSWRSDTSPFPGLRSFDPGQHDVFFGRAAEVNELGALLRSPARRSDAAVQLVVGPSGCGKSSLVRAGLLPVMAEEPGWCTLAPMTPGVDPVGALVRELAAAARGVGIERTLDEVRERLRTDGLSRIVDELLHAAPGPRRDRMLLVVDQFEELLAQAPPQARAEFAAVLRPAIAGSLQVVATLRPEFLDQLLVSTELAELATRTFTLRPLLRSALPDVVEGPARLAGMVLDEGLVTRLVADTEGGEALPLLAYTLAELAEGLGRGGLLSTARYEELGGVRGAVTEQAAAALAEAVRGGRTERQVLDDLLRLVTVDEQGRPTRRRVPRAELPSTVLDALDPFVERRLLVVDSGDDGAVIGVAHEAFLTAWPPLAEAVLANSTGLRARRGIEQAATEWDEAGRPASRLWERGQLAAALADTGARVGRTLVTERVDVSPRGLQFLQVSRRHDRLRRGRSTAVLTVLLVLALTAATVAVVQMRSAAQQQRLATSRFLMTQAQTALADDPRTALQLGEAAQHISPDAESGAQLAHLVRSTPYAGTLPGRTGSIATAEFSPDGRILATGTREHTVVLWDVTDRMRARPIGPPLPLTGEVIDLVFSPDGRLLAVRGDDHTVVLWDVTDPERARTLGVPLHHDGSVTAIAFSPDGRSMVTAADDGLAVLWSLGDPAAPAPLRRIKHTGRVYAVAFSPDGRLLATGDSDGLVALWDLRDLARSTRHPVGARNSHTVADLVLRYCGWHGMIRRWR